MKISRTQKDHLKKIASLGGKALKKKMPEGYFTKLVKRRWRLERKRRKEAGIAAGL